LTDPFDKDEWEEDLEAAERQSQEEWEHEIREVAIKRMMAKLTPKIYTKKPQGLETSSGLREAYKREMVQTVVGVDEKAGTIQVRSLPRSELGYSAVAGIKAIKFQRGPLITYDED